MDSSSCSPVEWRNLPKDLLSMIAKRSDETRALRAVCSSWRSSLAPPLTSSSSLFSATIPLPRIENEGLDVNIDGRGYFTLGQRRVYCLEPLSGGKISNEYGCRSSWMVKLEETSSGKMRMSNAISNYKLPEPRGRNKYPSVLNLSSFRVICVGKEYNLCPRVDAGPPEKISIRKVIVSESEDAILCIFNEGRNLGYFKFGDEHWTMIDRGDENTLNTVSDYTDIVCHKGRFYVVENDGKIGVVNTALEVKVEAFASLTPRARTWIPNFYRVKYFVQSNGDLFVADKSYDSTYYGSDDDDYGEFSPPDDVVFKIYRLNENQREWVEVSHLDDHTFFIGNECSYSVSTKWFSGCKKNSVYCSDDIFAEGDYDGDPGFDVGIFVLKTGSSERIRRFSKYSRLFWPFQKWLMDEGVFLKPPPSSSSSSRRRRYRR